MNSSLLCWVGFWGWIFCQEIGWLFDCKMGETYSIVMGWVRPHLSFAILWAALLCVRGSSTNWRSLGIVDGASFPITVTDWSLCFVLLCCYWVCFVCFVVWPVFILIIRPCQINFMFHGSSRVPFSKSQTNVYHVIIVMWWKYNWRGWQFIVWVAKYL